jgi:adenosylcobinamide-GDP ribazoletransferase
VSEQSRVRATGVGGLLFSPLIALELLTVLRLRRPPIVEDRVFGASQAWFPLVGLAFGGALYGIWQALDGTFSPAVLGWLLVAALAILSGGLHVDGLADTVDGLYGGRSREDSLRIMRDSHVGALGAAGVVLLFGLKAACFASLAAGRAEALLLTPVLSRWAMVVAIAAFPYARESGLGTAFNRASLPWPAMIATLTAVAAAVALIGVEAAVVLAVAGLVALTIGSLVSRRLGGLTGDVYGAINESVEVVLLLTFLVLAAEGFFA